MPNEIRRILCAYARRDKVNERVAIELNQLRFLVGKGQEMSYVETVQPRIQKIESALRSSLAASLRSSLSACDTSPQDDSMTLSLTQCLRTYAAIDQTTEAEDIIAREFVQPFIEKVADHPSCLELLRFRLSYTHLECACRIDCPLLLATATGTAGRSLLRARQFSRGGVCGAARFCAHQVRSAHFNHREDSTWSQLRSADECRLDASC